MNGQQLVCIEEAVPIDSTPSSVHLHLSEQLLFVYTRTQVPPPRLASLTHCRMSLITSDPVSALASGEGVAAGWGGAPPEQQRR